MNELFSGLSVLYSKRLYDRDSVFIFDEVQRYPKARELVKHLVADGRYDYIETGSLISIKKNVKDILIPSEEEELLMYPMDFEEFLKAVGDEVTYDFLKSNFENKKPLGNLLKTVNEKFRLYMLVGGMPQAVLAYRKNRDYDSVEKAKRAIIKLYREDIVKYADKDVAAATAIFNSIPSQLSHHDKKIKFSALGVKDRYEGYADAIFWIAESMVGNLCYGVDEPDIFDEFGLQTDHVKCYMADTGLLLTMAAGDNYLKSDIYKSFVLGKLSVNKGMMTENVVAQMLKTIGHDLRFYEKYVPAEDMKKKKYEVDFLIKKDRNAVPIEVKSSNSKNHPSLDYMSRTYKNKIGKPIVLTKGDLRETEEYMYVPLPMTMFL